MTLRTSVHDNLFRHAMSDTRVAKEFFSRHLPERVRQAINLESLSLCPQSYVDSELKATQSDIVYRTEIAHQPGYLALVVEHQSTPDPLMAFRLLKYNIGLWQNHLKQTGAKSLPLIVNIVFFNGRMPYGYSTDFRDLFLAPRELVDEIWAKPFKLINVQDFKDEELIQHYWSGIVEYFMKNTAKRDFLPYLKQAIHRLQWLEQQEGGAELLLSLLHYVLTVGETPNIKEFISTVKRDLSPPMGEQVMTIAEQLIEQGKQYGWQQGLQQGIEQGIRQGTRQGEHMFFLRQLKHKFSMIPVKYLAKIDEADEDTLLAWGERFVNAQSLEDIFDS